MSKHFIGVGLPKLLSTARHVHEMFSNVPGFRGIADAVNMYVPGKALAYLETFALVFFSAMIFRQSSARLWQTKMLESPRTA